MLFALTRLERSHTLRYGSPELVLKAELSIHPIYSRIRTMLA